MFAHTPMVLFLLYVLSFSGVYKKLGFDRHKFRIHQKMVGCVLFLVYIKDGVPRQKMYTPEVVWFSCAYVLCWVFYNIHQ